MADSIHLNSCPMITSKELGDLLNFFSSTQYKLKDTEKKTTQIEETCIRLMSKDYANLIVIPNDKGQLSTSYPSKIVIPEINQQTIVTSDVNIENQVPYEDKSLNHSSDNFKSYENSNKIDYDCQKLDVKRLKDLISKARVARCRARFPIPAILYRNKYICRSATLSSAAEIYGRSVLDYTFNDKNSQDEENVQTYEDDDFVEAHIENSPPNTLNIGDTTKLFSHIRNQDIKLLKYFQVKLICDLMLEKKKVKFGMNVTSSEKADKKNRYSEFNILSLPYPGCEFFREYRDNSYCGEGLIYDWNQDFVDAEFGLLNCDEASKILNLNFKEYRSWDVIRLTQNYMKLMLYFLKEFDSSILIHCISGWDRTPLFISLLRLSLWADGEIHRSLNAAEITYLTVAYDWLLFGHNLNDRLNKGEEIMFFCFQFLKFLTGDDYSINNQHVSNNKHDLIHEEHIQALRKISTESFATYEDFIIENIPNYNIGFKGSSASLNPNNSSNGSNGHGNINHKQQEDSFSLISAEFEIESSSVKNSNLNLGSNENVQNMPNLDILSSMKIEKPSETCKKPEPSISQLSSSPPAEMISTLTLNDDSLANSNHFSSPPNHEDSYEIANNLITDEIDVDLHSSTKPVEIPINYNKNNNSITSVHNGSLCRSESWQFVSDASSIIENNMFHHYYSSPDSLSSLNNKKSASPMNGFSNSHQTSLPCSEHKKNKSDRRKDRLLEVRSLFNSAYMSINFSNYNNGCSLTNFVDHIFK